MGEIERRPYDSVKWRTARQRYLNQNPLCVMCERQGRTTVATIVDHVKPWKEGRTEQERHDLFWNRENWQSLCASCHSGIKRIQDNHGISQACDINGLPIDGRQGW